MRNRSIGTTAALIFVALAGGWGVEVLNAQQPGFTRKIVNDQDLSVSGRHVVTIQGDFAPVAATGKHTHPGEELGYVLEGALVIEVEGKPPLTVKPGEVFFVPAGAVHEARNAGTGATRALVTYIVEKGKPIAAPAK